MARLILLPLLCLTTFAAVASAAPRDVQFRSIDFETNVLELFNFGAGTESLNGWRFCTHDDNQTRRYTSSSGLNGVSIDAGESLFLHFDNDASGPDALDISSLGGSFALPLDRGPHGLGLYINSNFGSGASLADHVQWSIDGVDNTTADERSDEAEGQVWTDQSLWVATTPSTLRLELNDLSGAALHGPGDYTAVEPIVPGDYDGNGTVGPEDYTVWANGFGQGDGPADGNGDDQVDAADYTVWRDNLPAESTSVPEPAGGLLVVSAAFAFAQGRRRWG